MFSAGNGVVLLGFTDGGFVGIGDPYLFSTIAAVAVGGTSLAGGQGGYANTTLGTFVLTLLTSVLVGYGVTASAQQVVMGVLKSSLVSNLCAPPLRIPFRPRLRSSDNGARSSAAGAPRSAIS